MELYSLKVSWTRTTVCLLSGSTAGLAAVFLPTPDVLGIIGLACFCFFFAFFAYCQPYPHLTKVLLAAFAVRAFFALIHTYVTPLPDSGADAVTFERVGWELAQGWKSGAPFEFITGAYLYSLIIGLVYFVSDRSPVLIQALNVLMGSFTVYIIAVTAHTLYNSRTARIAGWIAAFFPALVLYSAITMREVAVVFPFALSVLFFVRWLKDDRSVQLIKSLACLLVSGLFHTGMLFITIVPVSFWLYRMLRAFVKIKKRTFVAKVLASVLIVLLIGFPLVTGAGLEKVGNLGKLIEPEYLGARHETQARDRAAYLTDLTISSPADLVYAAPAKAVYFLFAPFPWQVSEAIDFVGMIDGLCYLGLVGTGFFGLRQIRRKHGRDVYWGVILLLIVAVGVFAMGTGNYGTALRHRAKLVFLFLILASPVIQYLWIKFASGLRVPKPVHLDETRGCSLARDD